MRHHLSIIGLSTVLLFSSGCASRVANTPRISEQQSLPADSENVEPTLLFSVPFRSWPGTVEAYETVIHSGEFADAEGRFHFLELPDESFVIGAPGGPLSRFSHSGAFLGIIGQSSEPIEWRGTVFDIEREEGGALNFAPVTGPLHQARKILRVPESFKSSINTVGYTGYFWADRNDDLILWINGDEEAAGYISKNPSMNNFMTDLSGKTQIRFEYSSGTTRIFMNGKIIDDAVGGGAHVLRELPDGTSFIALSNYFRGRMYEQVRRYDGTGKFLSVAGAEELSWNATGTPIHWFVDRHGGLYMMSAPEAQSTTINIYEVPYQ